MHFIQMQFIQSLMRTRSEKTPLPCDLLVGIVVLKYEFIFRQHLPAVLVMNMWMFPWLQSHIFSSSCWPLPPSHTLSHSLAFVCNLRVQLISHSVALLGCCGRGSLCMDEKSTVCVCVPTEPATTGKEAVPCCQLNGCLQRPLWKESLPPKLIHGESNTVI